ncbi:MAG: RNA methyltransferase, partial [Thermoprotei archaeon]
RRLRNSFTKVVLDAPCSGEGLIPIDPESIRKRRVEDLYIMASKQVELLKIAYEVVRKGGEIVYSTCSIAPEENEFVLNEILNTLEDRILIEDPGINVGVPGFTEVFNIKLRSDLRKCIRLYPHKHGTEGFFICKLKKIG